jgi:hypothetical protein
MPEPGGGSSLMMDEFFEAGDDRFLEEVLKSRSDKKLRSFAAKWLQDTRPFARRMLLAYVDDGCDRPNHRPLVKAIFKRAEKDGDDELMGHFLVAFDRIVRRRLVTRRLSDFQSRVVTEVTELKEMPRIPRASPRTPSRPSTSPTRTASPSRRATTSSGAPGATSASWATGTPPATAAPSAPRSCATRTRRSPPARR